MGSNIDGVIPQPGTVIEPMTGVVTPTIVTNVPTTTTKEDALDVLSRSVKTLIAVYAAFITADGFNILGISTTAQLKVTAIATFVTAAWNIILKVRLSLQS
jgi:hypothetical protein